MMDQASAFHEVVRSPECVRAWTAVLERPLTFAEFSELPMPQGCAADELWRDFAVLRRCAGITFHVKPWFYSELDVSWASVTKETERGLEEIAQLSAEGSALDERLKSPTVAVGLAPLMAREVRATCHRDGFDLSREDATALWLRQRQPRTPEERAVANLVAVFNDIASYAKRPFSMALVERLHEDLVEGTGELSHLKPYLIYEGDSGVLWSERLKDREFAMRTVFEAVSHANPAPSTSILECAVSFYEVSAALWDLRYFPSLNALTELAVRWTLFAKCGRRALSFVPFTAISRKSENRYDRQFVAEFQHLSTEVGSETGLDCTFMFAGTVRTLLAGLGEVDRESEKLENLMEGAMEALEGDGGLNWRQREFLAALARNPRLSFKVKDYADMFDVVRVTARADLRDLVKRGYLEERTEQRAAVFSRAR